MERTIVTRAEYEKQRLITRTFIKDTLNREYMSTSGFAAGNFINVDFAVNNVDGTIGITMNNNVGPVSEDFALKIVEALSEAVELAANFKYLGYHVI